MAGGHKVKFYINAQDHTLIQAVVGIINKDPKFSFDVRSFAKDCLLRQSQLYLDQIRKQQAALNKKEEEASTDDKAESQVSEGSLPAIESESIPSTT